MLTAEIKTLTDGYGSMPHHAWLSQKILVRTRPFGTSVSRMMHPSISMNTATESLFQGSNNNKLLES